MAKFYRIQLKSGKTVFINLDHIVAAEFRPTTTSNTEVQLTMDNSFIFSFSINDEPNHNDNKRLSDLIKQRPI